MEHHTMDIKTNTMGPQLQSRQGDDKVITLLDIPLEVILQITGYLNTEEYSNLRLVCRRLTKFLFAAFARDFFTKRQFTLTESSLQALIDISQSKFGPYLKYLVISLERPPSPGPDDYMATQAHDLNYVLRYNRPRDEYVSHQTLISSGQDVELLVEAFRSLPNLQTVSLRDFCSPTRHRDGTGHTWNSYGAPTFLDETGRRFEFPRFGHGVGSMSDERPSAYVSHAFLAILRALGKMKGSYAPPRFEVILREVHLPDTSFNIPRYLERTIVPVLADLKALFLDLGPKSFHALIVNNNGHHENCSGFLVRNFLSKAVSLEHLRLNFKGCRNFVTKELLLWLAGVPEPNPISLQPSISEGSQKLGTQVDTRGYPPSLPRAPDLPHLDQLDIGMTTLTPDVLLNLYKRHKPTKITLHKVTIKAEQQTPTMARTNQWTWLFAQIAKSNLSLLAINLSSLHHMYKAMSYPVQFKPLNQNPKIPGSSTKQWSGLDFKRSAKEFIESVAVQWPNEQDMDVDDDDDDIEYDDDADMGFDDDSELED
ncbi:uncharacterized protein F4822DRAFT_319153 [Hypoxylon trugodes]|uniref:uncharacterized protein n=1 Tax=Hypoxylon trugodes TaxID=326681 RepID=UPI002194B62B|nr:uncharacterized protein F4822DRAFT_319153 [Hypoxylon trugodes]KAI1386513.1 hypothetical protein F4822DRAFT_319153 [Hypoxylon trugodes]